MKTKKRILAFMLLMVCVFTSACLGEKESTNTPLPSGANTSQIVDAEVQSEIEGYIKTPIEGLNNVICFSVFENNLYAATDTSLIVYDGVNLSEIYTYVDSYIVSLDTDNNGIWILETVFDGTPEDSYRLLHLGFDGKELFKSNMSLIQGYEKSWGIPCDLKVNGGICYVSFYNNCVAFLDGKTNEFIDSLSFSDSTLGNTDRLAGLCKNGEGVFACLHSEGTYVIKPIDNESEKNSFQISLNIYGIYDAPRENVLYYSDGSGLYEVFEDSSSEAVIIWSENAITNSRLQAVQPFSDGFVVLDDWNVYFLEKSILQPKTILKLAAIMPINSISKYIQQFNQTSTDYYIEVEDMFSIYGSQEKVITALNTQLIAGQGPDILYFGSMSADSYGTNGYLLDLYEMIDNDTDVTRDDFICLKAMETQGKLYTVTPCFSVDTCIGLSEVFGEKEGWTFEEYFDMESKRDADNPMVMNISKESFLDNSLFTYIQKAIDWDKYTCDFNNEEFISILEAAERVQPADKLLDEDYLGVEPEMLLVEDVNVIQPYMLMGVLPFANMENNSHKELCFIGWPSPNGMNTSSLVPIDSIGISALSQNRDAAWEFIKYMISDEVIQENICARMFPILKTALENQIYVLLHPFYEFEGMEITKGEDGGFYAEGEYYDIEYDTTPLITQRQADKVVSLLNRIEQNSAVDNSVFNIVKEEASVFFAGDRTAHETAELIQSRVQIYVAEKE